MASDMQNEITQQFSDGKSSSVVCREIFTRLLEERNVDAMICAIQTLQDIPEEIIVEVLSYILSTVDNISDDINCFKSPVFSHINVLLALNFTDIFLHEHLRQIPSQNVKILLRYLCQCLKSPPQFPRSNESPVIKIVDWLCVLLDAHFHTVTLTSDREMMAILKLLRKALKSKFNYLEELDKLESTLANFRHVNTSSVPRAVSYYTIEKLVIP